MTAPIDKSIPIVICASAAIGAVGALGGHLVRAYMRNISLTGVAATCAFTPLIALSFMACRSQRNTPTVKEVALAILAAYPIAASTTLLIWNVNPLHPIIGFAVGSSVLVGSISLIIGVGFFFHAIFKMNS